MTRTYTFSFISQTDLPAILLTICTLTQHILHEYVCASAGPSRCSEYESSLPVYDTRGFGKKLVPLQNILIIFRHFIIGLKVTISIQFESSLGQENQLIKPSYALNLIQ